MERTGQKLIKILTAAWKAPFTTKCDLARYEADTIAKASELGLITCKDERGNFTNVWRLSLNGAIIMFMEINEASNVEDCAGVLKTLGIEEYATYG